MTSDKLHVTCHVSHVTGYILAGGQSSRMGRDKALLPIGSRTLIELVMKRIQPLVDHVVVIGHPRNVQPLGELLKRKVLTDLKPGCGPLMGIYTGLMQTETALNLFLPCDMPWVEGRLIERLLKACHGEARVVASLHPAQGVQPFPLICHVKACRAIGALLDRAVAYGIRHSWSGRYQSGRGMPSALALGLRRPRLTAGCPPRSQESSLQALLRGPHAQLITVEEPDLWQSFTNVNTLSDYAKLYDATTLTR